MVSCLSRDVLSVVMHVKKSQEISFTKGGTESGWPFIGFYSWQSSYVIAIYLYMLGTTTKLSMLQVLLFLDFKLDLQLAVTEINIKKSMKQDKKKKHQKDVGMACMPKSMQTR